MRSHLTSTFTGTFPRSLADLLTGGLTGTGAEMPGATTFPPGTAVGGWSRAGALPRFAGPDDGMATTEYAIATVAAAGFAGLLVVILRSAEVRGLLTGLVRSALTL